MADTGRNAWKWEKYKNVYFVRLWCYLYVYKSTIFWVAQAGFRNKKGVKKFREVLKKFVRFEDNMKSEASFAKDERVSDSIPSGRWMWFLYKCYLKILLMKIFLILIVIWLLEFQCFILTLSGSIEKQKSISYSFLLHRELSPSRQCKKN